MSNSDKPAPPDATRIRAPEPSDRTQIRPSASHAEAESLADESAEVGATLLRPSQRTHEPTMIVPPRASSSGPGPVGAVPAEPTLPAQPAPQSKPQATKMGATNAAGATFDTGAVIRDRFVLESLLGRGGMGIVFAALDRRKEEARDPNPHIAIKILNADFRNHPDALIALQREARKAQTLAHPNVVTVFDFDRDGSSVYMTMERLRGRSLDAIVREARGRGIGREAALPIIRGIAEGLAYAHRKGIVHSDLKPGNVFVLEDGTPKILDFGIARAVPSAAAAEKDSFDAGSLGAYTEAYATKEMVEGSDPHPSDDVYALGLIAYELLTGQHAYQRLSAPDAKAKGIEPAAPKLLSMREWRALERSLAFDRIKRPVDAADFLKQFFGVTKLQRSMLAAAIVMALLAGFFGYRSWVAGGPAIPFEQLPADTQAQFTQLMASGDEAWAFYQGQSSQQGVAEQVLWDAVEQYADAYRLHPRNRRAVGALERTADAYLEIAKSDPAKQREVAQQLANRSDYLSKYGPVMSLL